MPLVYPVVVGLTLLSGCASDARQRRDSLEIPRATVASTRLRVNAGADTRAQQGAPERATPAAREASKKNKVRKPRKQPNVWVPERLRYRY